MDVRHAAVRRIRRLQELRRRRHAPGEPRQLATAAGIADNRCRAVGIDIERGFKIADTVGRRAGDVADRLLDLWSDYTGCRCGRPSLSGLQQTSNQIACYQMSGLFARREFAGPDGVRYARSKHIGDLARASVIFGITRVSTDWFFHLVRPARLVRLSGDHRSSEA